MTAAFMRYTGSAALAAKHVGVVSFVPRSHAHAMRLVLYPQEVGGLSCAERFDSSSPVR